MVKPKVVVFVLALGGVSILAVQAVRHFSGSARRPAVMPLPQSLDMHPGSFLLTPTSRIVADSWSACAGQLLAERLRQSTGYEIPLRSLDTSPGQSGQIILKVDRVLAGLEPESYVLEVTDRSVAIRAFDSNGVFYATQTLLQLFPPQIFAKKALRRSEWIVPCLRIADQPRFHWRGLMLDVSRHFFNPSEVKQLLDVMALHKLNTFHWHLTDDQGWRIEIKQYPRLTEVAAWRKKIGFNLDPKSSTAYDSQGRYGGFYSQAQIRDVIAYAQSRGITIVPEIEMPGHASAALAAYPEFSCSGGPYSTDMAEAVSSGVFCPGKEETFRFLENVLLEVISLFPGEFIHLGGDEVTHANWRKCPRCQARMASEGLRNESELQGYFIKRLEKFVDSHGKRMIGWSETQQDHLAPATVLMDWIGGAMQAARTGHDVVMSPEDYCYLDLYQARDRSGEPPAAGAYLPIEKVYQFEPIADELSPAKAHVLGAQANLWTEYIPSLRQAEYMALPRLCALAEVVWSPKVSRNWRDFNRRLPVQEQRLDEMGVNYRR